MKLPEAAAAAATRLEVVRITAGPEVPPALGRQYFDSECPNAQYLRLRFRSGD
ncbi:hypothetical protein [Streptomyces sp. NPDC091371]|uniref:hypothetical protein n=1 Tax=Streptomyces sp. NPDC091371 TaxID=3155303 RepID=UPI00342EAAE1